MAAAVQSPETFRVAAAPAPSAADARPPSATADLLTAASGVAAARLAPMEAGDSANRLAAFIELYKSWLIRELGMSAAPEVWAERSSILLHLMVGASTVREAIGILIQFVQTVWGGQTRFELIDDGDTSTLIVKEAVGSGQEALICALWFLKSVLIKLEFLAGGELVGVSGKVREALCIPPEVANLLFGRPLAYESAVAGLVFPRSELGRAVAVRAAEIPLFLSEFLLTSIGARRHETSLKSLVSTLIWSDLSRGHASPATMPEAAQRLGYSVATARRRLQAEGVTFRALKEDALDQLAKTLLRDTRRTIEDIAAQLDYSDPHAFRRAFRRRNGMPPRHYRFRAGVDLTVAP